MQLTERVKECNGCGACVVACKQVCVKMKEPSEGRTKKQPVVNEDGCNKCNACMLYCPLYNPVSLPDFEEYYEFAPEFADRDMPALYRKTMKSVNSGQHTEFIGTLCEIAALKSLMGDKLKRNLVIRPLWCSNEKRAEDPACAACMFYNKEEK